MCQVSAGGQLTLALTTAGVASQMGSTGAAPGKAPAPWEGATAPEPVRGALAGQCVEQVACGMHHAVALARALDRRTGRVADGAAAAVFAWGRGSQGQLGGGRWEDSAAPVAVEALRGRRVLRVAAGGASALAVCTHEAQRFEPEGGFEALFT